MFVKNTVVIISTEIYEEDIDLPQLLEDTYQISAFLHGRYIFLLNCPLFVVFYY